MYVAQTNTKLLPQKLLKLLEHQRNQKIPQNKPLMLKPPKPQPILELFYYQSETQEIKILKYSIQALKS